MISPCNGHSFRCFFSLFSSPLIIHSSIWQLSLTPSLHIEVLLSLYDWEEEKDHGQLERSEGDVRRKTETIYTIEIWKSCIENISIEKYVHWKSNDHYYRISCYCCSWDHFYLRLTFDSLIISLQNPTLIHNNKCSPFLTHIILVFCPSARTLNDLAPHFLLQLSFLFSHLRFPPLPLFLPPSPYLLANFLPTPSLILTLERRNRHTHIYTLSESIIKHGWNKW